MPVDASGLKKLGRRSLGAPPTDGNPGIEGDIAEPTSSGPANATRGINGAGEGPSPSAAKTDHDDAPSAPPEPQVAAATRESQTPQAQRRHRVPPPVEEPRIPFTTRVAASTKERLEEACYHLRVKHQVFIDEAIRAHLKKHGF